MNIHSTTCSGTNSFASFEEIWQTERTKINRIVEPEVDCEYDSDEWSSDSDSESDEDDSDEKDLLLQPSTSHQTHVVEEEEEEEAEEATDFLAAAYAGLDEGDVTTTAEGDGEALELHSWGEVVDSKGEVEVEESEICLPIAADSQDAKSDSALETVPETETISTSTVPACCDDNEHEDDLEDVTPVQSPSLALEEVGVSEVAVDKETIDHQSTVKPQPSNEEVVEEATNVLIPPTSVQEEKINHTMHGTEITTDKAQSIQAREESATTLPNALRTRNRGRGKAQREDESPSLALEEAGVSEEKKVAVNKEIIDYQPTLQPQRLNEEIAEEATNVSIPPASVQEEKINEIMHGTEITTDKVHSIQAHGKRATTLPNAPRTRKRRRGKAQREEDLQDRAPKRFKGKEKDNRLSVNDVPVHTLRMAIWKYVSSPSFSKKRETYEQNMTLALDDTDWARSNMSRRSRSGYDFSPLWNGEISGVSPFGEAKLRTANPPSAKEVVAGKEVEVIDLTSPPVTPSRHITRQSSFGPSSSASSSSTSFPEHSVRYAPHHLYERPRAFHPNPSSLLHPVQFGNQLITAGKTMARYLNRQNAQDKNRSERSSGHGQNTPPRSRRS